MKAKTLVLILTTTFLLAACGSGGGEHAHHQPPSPYSGEQRRAVKALSDEDVKNYLEGAGMGMAKAAELNGFPGPKHILENEAGLGLGADQKKAVRESFDRMKARAVELGAQIVEGEKQLDELFKKAEITSDILQAKTREIAELQGALRAAHLAAHLEMKNILSPAQIETYNRLRGYKN